MILVLEVLQTRIFAYSLDPLTIFLAIGVCLLGLGASGTLLSLTRPVEPERVRARAALFAAIGAASIPPAHLVFARLAPQFGTSYAAKVAVLVALTVPYFCLGMVVALILTARGGSVARAYAFNLAGSALGCLLVFPLLDALGAERELIVVAALGAFGALLLAPKRALPVSSIAVLLLALAALFPKAADLFRFPPDPTGQLRIVERETDALRRQFPDHAFTCDPLFQRWDRTARIDVYRLDSTLPDMKAKPVPSLFFVQDSSAGSILLNTGDDLDAGAPFFAGTVYGAGYAHADRGQVGDVLIIGLGGAPDVQAALYHGAGHVVGVEINQTTLDLVRNEYSRYLGDPYRRPEVEVVKIDGRTFLRATDRTFDLIQMSGVDVKSKFSPGTLSANENFLYTDRAMVEMLERLTPDGRVVLNRFGDDDLHRLASIAIAGLRELGVEDPQRHLFAIGQGNAWRCVIVRRTPFPADEIARLHAWVEASIASPPRVTIPAYHWIGLGLNDPMQVLFSPEPRPIAATGYFKALAAGRLDDYIENVAEIDLSAPTDDRPFFFLLQKPGAALWQSPAFESLHRLLAVLFAIGALFIVAPLAVFRWRGLRTPGAGRALLYFTALGVGFMFVEIGLIHRFVLLLGHQSYAISIVLLGVLLGASLGSAWSQRLDVGRAGPLRLALLGLVAVLLATLLLGPLFEAAAGLGFAARLALALVVLIAIGIPLGVPFPAMLRRLQQQHGARGSAIAAWSVGINGFASVIGSTLALEVSMLLGLIALPLAGAALYGVALLAVGRGESRPA